MPNAEEIAYWNAEAGSRWAEFQERIDRAFAPLSAAGLAAAAVKRNEVVLDIGCGCGATSVELATVAKAVTGIDVSRSMLGVAERRAVAAGCTNAEFTLADASTYAFAGATFDVAFSRFGVMFFEDPVVAFQNIRSALKSTGRLIFVCWRELAVNPWFSVPVEAVRSLVPPQPKIDPNEPGPLSFKDPERVRDILERSGFTDIAFEPFDALLPFGERGAAAELLSKIGPTSRLLEGAGDETQRAAAVTALHEALRAHESGGNVALGAGVWIVSARPATPRG